MDYPNRKNTRLNQYDYATPGYYFVTVCTAVRNQNILSTVNAVGGAALGAPCTVSLTKTGQIVQTLIQNINTVYSNISVDTHVIMPDHIHLIIVIHAPESGSPKAATPTATLPTVINALKGLAAKRSGKKELWQRGYYEHIIRNDTELHETRQYIQNNPLKWILDKD